MFTISTSCTFREFLREPLKLQLRYSSVCAISKTMLHNHVDPRKYEFVCVWRMLDFSRKSILPLCGKSIFLYNHSPFPFLFLLLSNGIVVMTRDIQIVLQSYTIIYGQMVLMLVICRFSSNSTKFASFNKC